MRKVRVAPKGMGLNDFVAEKEGFFAAEGIEVEWDIKTFRGTQSRWSENKYLKRPQDKPFTEEGTKDLIQCACLWGTIPTPAPAWAASSATATACRLGRSSCGRNRRSASRRTSPTWRSRAACAPAA